MKKILLLCGMLIAVSATVASAASIDLAWDNCRAGGGGAVKAFACASNSGSNTLVASVKAPAGIDLWTAFEAEYIFNFGGPQPAWWQLRNQTGQLAQCRQGALSANAIGAGLTGCEDAYGGQGAGGIGTYQNNSPAAGNARLLLVFAVPAGNEAALIPDENYFVAKVVITNAKSTGTGACAGCANPACIELDWVKVVQPAGAPGGDVRVDNPTVAETPALAASNEASWQNTSVCLPVVSNTRSTWGGVKNLYR